MFGRFFSFGARFPVTAVVQFGAAAVVTTTAITDKQLLKKGEWYQKNVLILEGKKPLNNFFSI